MKYVRIAAFVLAFFFFAGALLNGALLNAPYRYVISAGGWQARIGCANSVCNLGAVSVGERFLCEFAVANRGNRELVIQDVKPSCRSCLEILAFPKEPLLPGGSGVVQVAFSTKGLKGKVNKGLVVRSNDPKQPAFMLRVLADVQTEVRDP